MTQKLDYTVDATNELLDYADNTQNLAILGQSNNVNVSLNGTGTPVTITNYQVSGVDGSMSEDPVAGTITIPEDGIYQLIMYIGVTEDAGLKEWELQLILDIDGSPILVDAVPQPTDKTNYISCSITATRFLTTGTVLKMQMASQNEAVSVDVINSTFEVSRRL